MGFLRRIKSKAKDRGSVASADGDASTVVNGVVQGNDAGATTTKRKGLSGLFRKPKHKSSTNANKTSPKKLTASSSSSAQTSPSTPTTVADQSPVPSRPLIAVIPTSAVNVVPSAAILSSFIASQELDRQTATSAVPSGYDGVARNLLAELELAMDAEGTELILPAVQYADSSFLGTDDGSEADHPDDEPPSPTRITVREKQPGEEEEKAGEESPSQSPEQQPEDLELPTIARKLDIDASPAEAAPKSLPSAAEAVLRAAEGAGGAADGTATDGSVDCPKENSVIGEEIDNSNKNDHDLDAGMTDSAPPSFGSASIATTHTIKGISGAIMNALSCGTDNAEQWSSMFPATCAPIINRTKSLQSKKESAARPSHEYFNDQFAVKFLHELLNVGFTLVYHKPVDEECWLGRTVNMFFKPGLCTSEKMVQPRLEWSTMGGGKMETVETKEITLLGVDSVSISKIRENPVGSFDNRDDGVATLKDLDKWCRADACSNEELDCFFTITSEEGEVHLFESLSSEESNRIVAGIKNVAARYCSQLIAGDSNSVADFFENSQEPVETQLSMDEAMLRVSNAFFDKLL